MASNDLPPLMVGLCAILFLLIAIFYPWLSRVLGVESPRPERRALAAALGLALLALWGIWYANAAI